jgi:exopolysaccharide biosynthesis polyprenyl glycosylphosphotransferase
MNSTLDRLAPTPLSRVHLLLDLLLMSLFFWRASHPGLTAGQALALVAVSWMVWIVAGVTLRAYQLFAHPMADAQAGIWAVQTLLAAGGVLLATELLNLREVEPLQLLVVALSLAATRVVMVQAQKVGGRPSQQVLIVGMGTLATSLGMQLERGRGRKTIVGFIPLEGEMVPPRLVPRQLGAAGSLAKVLAEKSVDEVYVAGSAVTQSTAMQGVVSVCEELGMPFALPVHSLALERAQPVGLDRLDLGFIHHIEAEERPVARAFKRLFDIASSGFALVVLSPMLLTVAALIKLTSAGPVFFRQPRVGMHGRGFNMLKFRSMVLKADEMQAELAKLNEQAGPVFKIKNDPRVTRIGRFIRRYSIDELPQLVNILRGEMSVVGPRPPVAKEVARYQPWQRRRLSVRPGLTCHWQVGGRNNIPFEEWMLLDLRYIDQWSFFTDLKLIARTIPAVLTGHGAS